MNIKTDTIVRTIVLAVALLNQILVASGLSPLPIEDETLAETVSSIITIIAAVWAWWKNNSFTPEAIEADERMRAAKASRKEINE